MCEAQRCVRPMKLIYCFQTIIAKPFIVVALDG